MADGTVTVTIELPGSAAVTALAQLYSVCRKMDTDRADSPPTDDEYRAAMIDAALVLRDARIALRRALLAAQKTGDTVA